MAHLEETGGLREMIEAVKEKADALEESEVSAWPSYPPPRATATASCQPQALARSTDEPTLHLAGERVA